MRRVALNGMIALAATGAMAVTMPAHEAFADSAADSTAAGSPGVISGDSIQLPGSVPVNLCGNTVDVIGVLNPALGVTCANEGSGGSDEEVAPRPPWPSTRPASHPPTHHPAPVTAAVAHTRPATPLAETGAGTTVSTLVGGAALVLGGAVLYRRSRRPGLR